MCFLSITTNRFAAVFAESRSLIQLGSAVRAELFFHLLYPSNFCLLFKPLIRFHSYRIAYISNVAIQIITYAEQDGQRNFLVAAHLCHSAGRYIQVFSENSW